MFKIKGYLKKFWYLILACICLLFVQAQTELTLPDYMSDIVSVGIQAGGFASPVSDVLTEETYQHLLLFLINCFIMIINYFEDTGNLLYLYFVGLFHISHTHISKYRNKFHLVKVHFC